MNKVYVIGVAPDGADSLTEETLRKVARADIVCGGPRLLDMFPRLTGERVPIGHNLAEIVDLIRQNRSSKRVVVLASGDPGFFGIAGYLTDALGKRALEIVPNVSAMQLAFARIGESWDDAVLVSAHARPIRDMVAKVRDSDKIGIFTGGEHTPAAIAEVLLDSGITGYWAYVCENLGGPDERITRASLRGLTNREFAPLNTLILLKDDRKASGQTALRAPGIPDQEFHRRGKQAGMITKQEVRAISLARLRVAVDSTVWDIGAGSGALAIEASFLARKGLVCAVEKNQTDVAVIKKNVRRFRADNVQVVHAGAPAGLDDLPAPSAVFIGGSGGEMAAIIETVSRRLRPGGRIVLNLVALENLSAALDALRKHGFEPEITLVNTARSTTVGELTRLAALNPVFIVSAVREGGNSL